MKTVLCVIPHYGKDEDLMNCISSLLNTQYDLRKQAGILLIIKIEFNQQPSSELLNFLTNSTIITWEDYNGKNDGFTKSINQGIQQELFHFVWLLNNDTVIPNADTILSAIKLFDLNPKIGIVGSQTRDINNTNFIHHGGTTQMFPNGLHKTGLVSENQLQEDTIEKWVSFCSVFISKKCLIYTGLLDGNLFNFYSDSDYCLRARLQGFEVWHCHNSVVFHEIGQSANPNAEQRKQMALDFEYFNRKWFGSKIFKDLTQGI